MRYTVTKFGGASVTGTAQITAVAKLLSRRAAKGENIVAVVSAEKSHTDRLSAEMREMTGSPADATRDFLLATGEMRSAALLAAALQKAGTPAQVVAPWALFHTDAVFGDATIEHVSVSPLKACFAKGILPVVPGFIGSTALGSLTTLGRGGSDYSAVALGVALRADCVELHKAEVDGIYDADPNSNASARRFAVLTHEEAVELASNGAKVLNIKAAKLAQLHKVPVWVLPTFRAGEGTKILSAPRHQNRRACETLRLKWSAAPATTETCSA
jgi:aspartate kinase